MSNARPDQPRRIVVGVDGSECSKTALRWAIGQATLTGDTVEAVHAWRGQSGSETAHGGPIGESDSVAGERAAATEIGAMIAAVTAEHDHPVDVVVRIEPGLTVQVLLAASIDAQLLVVGSRGHNPFSGMLLGSVSQHCVQHAACSVVVAR
ncbi:MAG TPA: universal stress protein [Micromonosporaceae bacterium]|jgi:nucleotide-binding universal stress UspA family protein